MEFGENIKALKNAGRGDQFVIDDAEGQEGAVRSSRQLDGVVNREGRAIFSDLKKLRFTEAVLRGLILHLDPRSSVEKPPPNAKLARAVDRLAQECLLLKISPKEKSPQRAELLQQLKVLVSDVARRLLEGGDALSSSGNFLVNPLLGADLLPEITLHPDLDNLGPEACQVIGAECLARYHAAEEQMEQICAEIAYKHPEAQSAAREMLGRMVQVAKAYHAYVDNVDQRGPLSQILKNELSWVQEFQTYGDGSSAGGVGHNAAAIRNVARDGNLRERMTAIYSTLWTLLPKVFGEDDSILDFVNEHLEGFELNRDLVHQARSEGNYFPQHPSLAKFRQIGGRSKRVTAPPRLAIENVKDLSARELLASDPSYEPGKEGGSRRRALTWELGAGLFQVERNNAFFVKTVRHAKQVVTGPSGTTDSYIRGLDYFNMPKKEWGPKMLLALAGWLVPFEHSLHEVRVAGAWHGFDYDPSKSAYQEIYPGLEADVERAMHQQGQRLPKEWLSAEGTLQVAKDLKFIK